MDISKEFNAACSQADTALANVLQSNQVQDFAGKAVLLGEACVKLVGVTRSLIAIVKEYQKREEA